MQEFLFNSSGKVLSYDKYELILCVVRPSVASILLAREDRGSQCEYKYEQSIRHNYLNLYFIEQTEFLVPCLF